MIIAFTGKKRSGKSEASKYLVKQGFTPINFKDALVEEIKENFPKLLADLSEIYELSLDELFHVKPPAIRSLLQNYGTEVRRGDCDEYWVNKWLNKAVGEKNVVVDDCRFLNEAEAVRLYNGLIYRISRVGCVGDGHKSETEMDEIKVDDVLENDGELCELHKQLDQIINQ